jgi:nucleoid-associated protein YgaU
MPGREQQVEQALRAQGVQVQNLKIQDLDGKVITIKGSVASDSDKARVEQIAESIPGVKVANHLSVGGGAGLSGGAGGPGSRATAGGTYTVKKGDSLSKIAKEAYGDASKWKIIHAANKAKVPNPDLIHPGDQLTIPGA